MTNEERLKMLELLGRSGLQVNQLIIENTGTVTYNDYGVGQTDLHAGSQTGLHAGGPVTGGGVPAVRREMQPEAMARAIEACQEYFWGNSSYAVVFCIWRDDYKMHLSQTDFETMAEQLPYQSRRDYRCTTGTIANAFSNNPIFSENISRWDDFSPLPRIIKLRDALRRELKLQPEL